MPTILIDQMAPVGVCLLSSLLDKRFAKVNGEAIFKKLEVCVYICHDNNYLLCKMIFAEWYLHQPQRNIEDSIYRHVGGTYNKSVQFYNNSRTTSHCNSE